LALVKLSQAASGYFRSTPLLQFQSQDPFGAATVWKPSSALPETAEQVAAPFAQTNLPTLMQAP
jgi:hypothetical protein